MNLNVAYPVLGVYIILVMGAGLFGVVLNLRSSARHKDKVREHFTTTSGLGTIVWFFTMSATLFSGYSVSGIVNEAYGKGWVVTRWICAGVGIYMAFALMAPRLHALGKSRGYMTISQYLHDRFMQPASSRPWVGHAVALLAFASLQLPIFTYLITQFRSLGAEVRAFTANDIDVNTSVLTAAGILLVLDFLGGMRAVAFTDVLQGAVLFLGSIIFLIVQRTELGGLAAAHDFWSNPALTIPGSKTPAGLQSRVWWLQHVPPHTEIVNYFDFVAKTTLAATMFPHLTARLFAAHDAGVMKKGLAAMNFSFFLVQLSSMITGWTAVYALRNINLAQWGGSPFGAMLRIVSTNGDGPAFAAALLLAAAICAMMSTADSALLAFSSMWVRDVYARYIRPKASQLEQIIFGKVMAFIGLSIGVGLAIQVLKTNKPDLSGLFALQNVTPIHVTPAVWLSLHWRGLRGEAVLAGMVAGLGVTLGLLFSDANIQYAAGNDRLKCGLSSALVGFFANLGITVLVGLVQQYGPAWLRGGQPTYGMPEADALAEAAAAAEAEADAAAAKASDVAAVPEAVKPTGSEADSSADSDMVPNAIQPVASIPLDIGPKRDRVLKPWLWAWIFLVLLFTTPFYRVPKSWDGYVGDIGAWPFTSLFLAGLLALTGVYVFMYLWEDYVPYDPISRKQALESVKVAVDAPAAPASSDSEEAVAAAAAAAAKVAPAAAADV